MCTITLDVPMTYIYIYLYIYTYIQSPIHSQVHGATSHHQLTSIDSILILILHFQLLKMPPYFDGPHYDRAAKVLNQYSHVVKYVASINTIGNCLMVDPVAEMPVIRSKGGFAGLSGRAVKYTALANVKKMRELLVDDIDVVGAGGVFSGQGEQIFCLHTVSILYIGIAFTHSTIFLLRYQSIAMYCNSLPSNPI